MATGVANPRAHGQLITRTATALDKANSKLWPAIIHTIPVTIAIPITMGTKIPLTLSATRAIGALEFPASSTSLMICANVVSCPTLVASKIKEPF